jgi:hypothetical protein
MNYGRLYSKKPTIPGFGSPCAAKRDKWSHMQWVIGVKRPASGCGKPFHPQARTGHCFTDFWAVYAAVIPSEQHTTVGKETGETAHVERWNNTLRQRLARFVRMTLSFSRVSGDARSVSSALPLSLQS